jgi:hypothetical protein
MKQSLTGSPPPSEIEPLTLVEDPAFRQQMAQCLPRVHHDLAADLLQIALLNCWLAERDCPGQTLSWYLQHGLQGALAWWRKGLSLDSPSRRHRGYSLDDPDAPAQEPSDPACGFDPQQEIEVRDFVARLLCKLKPNQVAVLILLIDGWPTRQGALKLRISPRALPSSER